MSVRGSRSIVSSETYVRVDIHIYSKRKLMIALIITLHNQIERFFIHLDSRLLR